MDFTPSEVEQPAASWRGKDVILIVGAIFAILIAFGLAFKGYLALSHLPPETVAGSTGFSIFLGAIETVALLAGVYFAGLHRRGLGWEAAGLKPTSRQWMFAGAALGLIAIPLTGLIATGVQLLFDLPVTNPQLDFLAPEGFSWVGAVGMFVFGGLLAPLAEEVFFRGVLYAWLRGRFGVWPGILISGLIFGLVHAEVSISVATAVMGFGLAWLYEHSDSLWPPVLVHVLNNAFKILLLYLLLAVDPTSVIPGL